MLTFRGLYQIMKNSEDYSKSKDLLIEGIKEFSGRLGYVLIILRKNPFHGGDSPDEADFFMFGILKSRIISSSFSKFIEEQMPIHMADWMAKMDGLCRYEQRSYIA